MTAPLTPQITLTELIAGQASFATHYSVSGIQNFAPDLTVSWDHLKKAVEVDGGISNIKEIAIKLIHMYDTIHHNWFLTMECCQLDLATGKIIAFGNRFTIENGSVTPSTFQGDYDPDYFANVLCDSSAISPNTYINNVIFPWYQQISEMHCQNNLPDNDATIQVKFSACTYDYSGSPKLSLVQWPHIVLILMNATAHGDYVDDADYTELFTNRAADMAGLCPPKCNCYDWPASLPALTTCLI